jgi:hypothetical protein
MNTEKLFETLKTNPLSSWKKSQDRTPRVLSAQIIETRSFSSGNHILLSQGFNSISVVEAECKGQGQNGTTKWAGINTK